MTLTPVDDFFERQMEAARKVMDRYKVALASALARPEQKAHDGEPKVHELAAAHVFGLARNHAFVDGNKRVAIVAAVTFLLLNGYELTADDGTLYAFTMGVAAGEIDEEGAAAFFRDHTRPGDD